MRGSCGAVATIAEQALFTSRSSVGIALGDSAPKRSYGATHTANQRP